MQVKIIGGKSSHGRVSIISQEFVATACDEGGDITCEVKRHPYLLRFLFKNKRLLIPRVVRMALLLAGGMTGRGRMLLGLYVLGMALLMARSSTSSTSGTLVSSFLKQYWWAVYVIILPAILLYTRCRIATWHGAEHMTIAAYDRTGSTDIKQIAQECPVHDKCGGRLLLPIILGAIIARLLANNLGVSDVIVSLVALECVLWVDTLRGWDKIPGTSHVSHLLQKYATTRTPGPQELLTAQRAIQGLVAQYN